MSNTIYILIIIGVVLISFAILYLNSRQIAKALNKIALKTIRDFNDGKEFKIENTDGDTIFISKSKGWKVEEIYFKKDTHKYKILEVVAEIENSAAQ